jgi:RNA polymerase sigma factor (sigma-70 family)
VNENCIAEAPRFEERLDAERRIDLLRRGLAQLDAPKRSMLDLYYVEELSVAEIARLQNKSISAVKMELLRSRRRLAEILKELGDKART